MSTQQVTLIKQDAVVDYLRSERCKSLAAEMVENLHYNIGIKGERFPEYILMETIHKLIAAPLVREIECAVTQIICETADLYYVGVLPHNVTLNK